MTQRLFEIEFSDGEIIRDLSFEESYRIFNEQRAERSCAVRPQNVDPKDLS